MLKYNETNIDVKTVFMENPFLQPAPTPRMIYWVIDCCEFMFSV